MSVDSLPEPGKIIAVHLSYPSRANQRGRTPAMPSYFLKPTSSLAVSGQEIERPAGAELLAFEGEVAIVMGSTARRVSPEEAWSYVSGVTASNDWGIYDMRAADKGSNVRSKGGDGFTPVGPAIIPAADIDPQGLRVRTWLNGELVQDDDTSDLLFSFAQIIADLSQTMTLEPGDLILTGTPAGSSVAQPGDTVEVEVDAPNAPGAPTTGKLVSVVTQGEVPFADYGDRPATNDHQRIEAWGSREAAGMPAAFTLTDELRERVLGVGVATLSVQLRKRGYNDTSIDGVFSDTPGAHFVGLARTLRYVPFRPDLFKSHGGGYNAQKRLIDSLTPGDVVVMEARGEPNTGTLGDVLALRAKHLGAVAIVTDGGVRDYDVVAEVDIPVYSQGAHPAVLGRRHVPWEVDGTIACGGTSVQPGDVIVGDGDGVLVIPPALLEEVLADAEVQEREEAWIADRIKEGHPIKGLFPLNAEWRARYVAETGDGA